MKTLAKTTAEAERVIAVHKKARSVPRVLWASLDEDESAFAERCTRLRKISRAPLLAAVKYGFAVPPSVQAVEFPQKLFWLLHPSVSSRYRVASGGRGSGKSWAIGTVIVLHLLSRRRIRILAAREIMRSLRESVHHLLTEKIEALKLSGFFEINEREIVCTATGSTVIFSGLWQNANQLKSLEGIDVCWVEEAEAVSQRSLEILTPTIRAIGSEIILSLNPDSPDAPAQGFIDGQRPDTRHVHVTYEDNPWFPPALEGERAYLQAVDDDAYRHVWLGECRTHSDAQVFARKYAVEEFQASIYCDGPYFGADWGFSQDPTTLVRCWIFERSLYIDYEAYALGCDIDRIAQLFDGVPDSRKHVIRADNARPETISYLQRSGYPLLGPCEKWSGSVEDGVAHIRSYERVVIHPRCVRTIEEFRLYSYRVDRLTNDVTTDLLDKNNHCIDALRYALEPLIRRAGVWAFTSV